MIKLSILILTIPNRRKTFLNSLLDNLEKQTKNQNDIEILVLYDNKKRSVGEKRTNLLKLAKGEYVTFIDDDDRISDDYTSSILQALKENPNTDCVVYDCICTINNAQHKIHCKYGIEYEYNHNNSGNGFWTGKPAHTMIYKTSLVQDISYVFKNYGEDMDWVGQAHKKIVHQTRIDKILYYYDFRNATSETR